MLILQTLCFLSMAIAIPLAFYWICDYADNVDLKGGNDE